MVRWRASGFVGLLVLLGGCGEPCVAVTSATRPLLIGESARVRIGRVDDSDCSVSRGGGPRYSWVTLDPNVVSVSEDGEIRALAPGNFRLRATRGSTTLNDYGFVLPAGWKPRVVPERATITVGEQIEFRVLPYDASGRELVEVPWQMVESGAFLQPADRVVDRLTGFGASPTVFRGKRPGKTTVTGEIARDYAWAELRIVEAGQARP